MKILRGFPRTSPPPAALAIGNFDGVHRGHRALLSRLTETAKRLGVSSAVLTFSPHPREFFAKKRGKPEDAPATITPLREKIQALSASGIDTAVIARFDEKLASLSAEDFIRQILVEALNIRHIIIGENFRFGKNRAGTTEMLRDAGKKYGFTVDVMATVTEGDERISSSSVRESLVAGDFNRASLLLGRPYAISGHVSYGNKVGRTIGFPTANIPMRCFIPVISGVFVTQISGVAENPLPAVSMIGTRPTVTDSPKIVLETHILGFTGSCYGKPVKVEFLKKLRDNRKFPDIASLTDAIRNDVKAAQAYFKKSP